MAKRFKVTDENNLYFGYEGNCIAENDDFVLILLEYKNIKEDTVFQKTEVTEINI